MKRGLRWDCGPPSNQAALGFSLNIWTNVMWRAQNTDLTQKRGSLGCSRLLYVDVRSFKVRLYFPIKFILLFLRTLLFVPAEVDYPLSSCLHMAKSDGWREVYLSPWPPKLTSLNLTNPTRIGHPSKDSPPRNRRLKRPGSRLELRLITWIRSCRPPLSLLPQRAAQHPELYHISDSCIFHPYLPGYNNTIPYTDWSSAHPILSHASTRTCIWSTSPRNSHFFPSEIYTSIQHPT